MEWEKVYAVVRVQNEPGDYALAIFTSKHDAELYVKHVCDTDYVEVQEWDVSNRAFMQIA